MNLNHAEVPFEVWCDSLEDTGIETEDLRLLFSVIPAEKRLKQETFGAGAFFGNGNGFATESGNGLGYGNGFGNGSDYGYEELNTSFFPVGGFGCGYGYGYKHES